MSIPRSRPLRLLLALFVMAVLPAGLVACGGDDGGGDSAAASAGAGADTAEPVTLRLGYFPNVTHATALVGVENGFFDDALADNVTLETSTFNAGPEAVEALFADALDATYIGPNPAINAYAQSDGEAIRIVSGATSGGAFLVVRDGIDAPEDLAGTTLASPQLANTQDVALRAWLQEEGYETDESGGGDVSITPQANADTLAAFQAGNIDGAWVPEPWATRLIQEGGGHVLVDERDLWPEGQYVTTHLIVRTEFLNDHPDVVKQLLEGQVAANEFVNANPAEAQALVNRGIEAATGKPIAEGVITAAWENLTFTDDPIASSLQESAADAESLGLLDPVDLDGIYDLSLLNEVLTAKGLDEVQGL
jgi:NitT/TauT family transport system substrate-binding protein